MVLDSKQRAHDRLLDLGILSPLNGPDIDEGAKWSAAPPVADLTDKTVGFLSNTWGGNAQLEVYDHLAGMLRDRFPLRDVIITSKEVHSRPAAADIIDDLARRCDVVVTGVCG